MRLATRLRASVMLVAVSVACAQERNPKPGFNLFSKDQDVQMGREYAAQVEKEMPLIQNAELTAWVQRIGQRLASQPEADKYPYTFKVVQDKSINAFALPGGPTFVHTGLVSAADNEAQIAGVLAHEIAHVALRHGTSQATKSQFWSLAGGLLGSAVGGGSISGQLLQLGIGLGTNSVLLKYSRDAERDADILGARIMNGAGYNPVEMARFFEKLEAETGKGSGLSQFFSDHPNPGNRVREVETQIQYFPKTSYRSDGGDLPRMKQLIDKLPAAPAQGQGQMPSAAGNPDPAASRPSARLKQFQGQDVSFSYPENWEVFQQGTNITIAPRTALFQSQIGYGMVVDFFQGSKDLRGNTEDLLNKMRQENKNLTVQGRARSQRINGKSALLVTLRADSPYANTNETDSLISIERPGGVFYMVLIAPATDAGNANAPFNQILRSIRFTN